MPQIGSQRLTTEEEWEALDLEQLAQIAETLAMLEKNVTDGYMAREYADQLAAPLIARRQVLQDRHNSKTH